MRILTVANVPPDPNSGAAGTVYHTNVALRALGHTVDEIWKTDLGGPAIRHGNLSALLEQPRRYLDAVRQSVARADYDVIQISQPQAYLAAEWLRRNGFKGLVINRSHGLELAVDEILPVWHRNLGVSASRFPRSLFTPVIRELLARQWPRVLKSCDGVVLCSRMDYDFLAGRFPGFIERCICIHHGVSENFTSSVPPPLSRARLQRLLYVGQYSFIKGHHILTQILERTLRHHPELTCTWVTEISAHDRIRARISTGLHPRLHLTDWISHADLPGLYDAHGIFLFPSLFEGAGKAALEALSRRLYLVSSDTGAMRDYIGASGGGRLCPVGDVDAFCFGIDQALAKPEECFEAAERGYELAKHMTWQACAERLVRFYRQQAMHNDQAVNLRV